jgi:hypothetical protein
MKPACLARCKQNARWSRILRIVGLCLGPWLLCLAYFDPRHWVWQAPQDGSTIETLNQPAFALHSLDNLDGPPIVARMCFTLMA